MNSSRTECSGSVGSAVAVRFGETNGYGQVLKGYREYPTPKHWPAIVLTIVL